MDQREFIAANVVCAGVFGAIHPGGSTRMVAYHAAVVNLTDELKESLELLFGSHLGGETGIHQTLSIAKA